MKAVVRIGFVFFKGSNVYKAGEEIDVTQKDLDEQGWKVELLEEKEEQIIVVPKKETIVESIGTEKDNTDEAPSEISSEESPISVDIPTDEAPSEKEDKPKEEKKKRKTLL